MMLPDQTGFLEQGSSPGEQIQEKASILYTCAESVELGALYAYNYIVL